MIRPSRNPLLFTLLATMFLVVRLADAHAHLCFDGKEPPATVHFADGEVHACESGEQSGHSGDKDVQLTPDVVLKKASAADVWLPPPANLEFRFVAQGSGEPLLPAAQLDGSAAPVGFLPPLRGPPARSSRQ